MRDLRGRSQEPGHFAQQDFGQTDRFDGTLPKAAIALNHAFVRTVDGNELANNYTGITVVAGDVAIKENRISVPPGGIRTKIFRDEHRPPEIQR